MGKELLEIMAKIRVKTMSKDMLAMQLHEAMQDAKEEEVRREIVARLQEHLQLLERLQKMPYEQRAVFWRCNYHLFDYLRIHGQVQREAGEFDSDVKENVKEILKSAQGDSPRVHSTMKL